MQYWSYIYNVICLWVKRLLSLSSFSPSGEIIRGRLLVLSFIIYNARIRFPPLPSLPMLPSIPYHISDPPNANILPRCPCIPQATRQIITKCWNSIQSNKNRATIAVILRSHTHLAETWMTSKQCHPVRKLYVKRKPRHKVTKSSYASGSVSRNRSKH